MSSGVSPSLRTSAFPSSFPLELQPIFNNNTCIQLSTIPGTGDIITEERITVLFPSADALLMTLRQITPLDDDVVKKVAEKLNPIIGKPTYPSEIAQLLFQLAFVDLEDKRLTQKQRTDYMGHIMSNLSCRNSDVLTQLFTFYYGTSFEHFSSVKM